MLVITNLIESRMGKLILNHLIENTCREFHNGFLTSSFFKLTLESDFLGLCFGKVAFKTIVTQQYYKNTSRFQTRAWSIYFGTYAVIKFNLYKLSFEPRFRMFIINGYKKQVLVVLGLAVESAKQIYQNRRVSPINLVSRDFWCQIVTLFSSFKSWEPIPNTQIV